MGGSKQKTIILVKIQNSYTERNLEYIRLRNMERKNFNEKERERNSEEYCILC